MIGAVQRLQLDKVGRRVLEHSDPDVDSTSSRLVFIRDCEAHLERILRPRGRAAGPVVEYDALQRRQTWTWQGGRIAGDPVARKATLSQSIHAFILSSASVWVPPALYAKDEHGSEST